MPRLSPVDRSTAEGKTKELLDGVNAKMGTVPNLLGTLANSPAALAAYLQIGDALSGGVFDAKTRDAIALTVAGINKCDYCASAHSFISSSLKVDQTEIARRLNGTSEDPKVNAVLALTRAVVETKGRVSDADLANARTAGVTDAEIAEIVAHVALNILTNYFNHVADTEIDFPVVSVSESIAA